MIDRNLWYEYERLKREWQEQNPDASHEQHEQAMRRIAEQLGI